MPGEVEYKTFGIYPVVGTQTVVTGSWTGIIDVPQLYDGLTIAYYLPYAGSGNATLNLTLSDGSTTGAVNCYYTDTSRLTTQYGAGSVIILTYFSAGSISVTGTDTTEDRWLHCDYNTDTLPSEYITGAASTIAVNNLTANRALVANENGKVGVSAITTTELGYLDGVTSAVQTQLNARATLTSGKVTPDQASSDLVSITANTTLALTHAGKFLLVNSTSAVTVTVPTNASVAFPIETEIEICRWNTGTATIAAASGVSLVATESERTIGARFGVVAMKKISENTWLLTGALG